jgi:GNAT superfamily N-acetyltransferase
MIGLLVIMEECQGQGLGSAAVRDLERRAGEWGCETLRIGAVAGNVAALKFWTAVGFAPTGETRPWRQGTVVSEVVEMEKSV